MKTLKKFKEFVNESTNIEDSISQWSKAIEDNSVQSYIDSGANPNFDNSMPLRLSIESENLEMTKVLVENGADLTLRGCISLKWAANFGNLEILLYLIDSVKSKLDDKQRERIKSEVILWLKSGNHGKNINMESAISKIEKIEF